VVLLIEQRTRRYWCANAGDSRCILARNDGAVALSVDHKPDRPDERERIESAGGTVELVCGVWRLNGGIAVSRALGDRDFKDDGARTLIADPEIVAGQISADRDRCAILACDGLFDVLSNAEAANLAADCCKEGLRDKT
jgi:serine/threonine protein phosphatase PrpC